MTKKKKILLSGSRGRMGREIIDILSCDNDCILEQEVDRGVGNDWSQSNLQIDLVIDFSSVELFRTTLDNALNKKIPFLSGTTGLKKEDFKKLETVAKIIPVFWSANMSRGINLLIEILGKMNLIENYDFQIEEFHHSKKLDQPSGTGILLQHELEMVLKRKLPPVMSGRGGGIFGIHKVWAMADEEILVFEHTALNRRVFARGAVAAGKWLLQQKPGLYGMKEMMANYLSSKKNE